ncbi:MAG: hypothetical protein ACLU18_14890 [Bacteroides thetaiotaomicron]
MKRTDRMDWSFGLRVGGGLDGGVSKVLRKPPSRSLGLPLMDKGFSLLAIHPSPFIILCQFADGASVEYRKREHADKTPGRPA